MELDDAFVDLGELVVEQPVDVLARCGPIGADLDDSGDLGKGQPGGLSPLDEPDSSDR